MTSPSLFPWSPAAVLHVAGADAFRFLQSQFSNDLRPAETSGAVYGLWLDRKGRIIADSFVIALGAAEYLLLSYASPATTIQEKLDAFIIADDVTLSDKSTAFAGFTLFGEGIGDLLAAAALPLPGDRPALGICGRLLLFASRRAPAPAIDLLAPASHALELRDRLAAATLLSTQQAQCARIRAALPLIPPDAGPGETPFDVGLEADAVSFSKGCFLGQEVMQRLRTTGRAARELCPVTTDTHELALPAELFANGVSAGELRSLARDGEHSLGLALIKRKHAAAPAFSLAADGPPTVHRMQPLE